MSFGYNKTRIALAVAAALGTAAIAAVPVAANADAFGNYVTGDFHNHTTCSDGSISMQKLVKKATDKTDTPWGLDWFVQAGHGGNGNRNCTLAEDASLATPAYPLVFASDGTTLQGPTTTWQNTNPAVQPKGLASGTAPNRNMWRWQSVQEFQYPLLEYLSALKHEPLFIGVESVVAGHEHSSMSIISGQMPSSIFSTQLPTGPGYSALGNATALSQWEYCFDRGDGDTSRGNATVGTAVVPDGNNWDCALNDASRTNVSWNPTAQKLIPAGGAGSGVRGHDKTVEAMKWMNTFHPNASYYVPAHLERAGPFNPDGNNGYNIESLRDFNNAAPRIAFGMETQPGHGASDARGEYTIRRNTIGSLRVDSVGGTTWGGTGVYGAVVGGVWDALLGEGRNFWFFASSDWHNRGSFGPDDRRTTQDFYPGEYQRDFVMVHDADGHHRRSGNDPLTPQEIVDGLRTGNSFASSGQLIDRLAFVACADTPLNNLLGNALVESAALIAAVQNTDVDLGRECATMGQKLVVKPNQGIIVAIAVHDPVGTNYSPYTFPNPSLAQIGVTQPLNAPMLDHIDVIRGMVTGYKTPGTAEYSGQWPSDWIDNPSLDNVPAGAKNTTAAVIRTFGSGSWRSPSGNSDLTRGFKVMSFRIPALKASQYVRLRGTNLPASVPSETDSRGNPLQDLYTNAAAVPFREASKPANPPEFAAGHFLTIPCGTVGTNVPANGVPYAGAAIDGCPEHLPKDANGRKMVAFDVAAWADLWFYSNPVFVEVKGSTPIKGVN